MCNCSTHLNKDFDSWRSADSWLGWRKWRLHRTTRPALSHRTTTACADRLPREAEPQPTLGRTRTTNPLLLQWQSAKHPHRILLNGQFSSWIYIRQFPSLTNWKATSSNQQNKVFTGWMSFQISVSQHWKGHKPLSPILQSKKGPALLRLVLWCQNHNVHKKQKK